MPSLRLSEIEELTTEFEDLSEIEKRRKVRKVRKLGGSRPIKLKHEYEDLGV